MPDCKVDLNARLADPAAFQRRSDAAEEFSSQGLHYSDCSRRRRFKDDDDGILRKVCSSVNLNISSSFQLLFNTVVVGDYKNCSIGDQDKWSSGDYIKKTYATCRDLEYITTKMKKSPRSKAAELLGRKGRKIGVERIRKMTPEERSAEMQRVRKARTKKTSESDSRSEGINGPEVAAQGV